MNRDIKFRAWRARDKFMFYPTNCRNFQIQIDAKGQGSWKIIDWTIPSQSCSSWEDKRNVIMQYTGLKDKNGVEIYEGDIVRHYIPELKMKVDNPITFENGAFFHGDFLLGNLVDEFENSTIQIIGNIYEKPKTKFKKESNGN